MTNKEINKSLTEGKHFLLTLKELSNYKDSCNKLVDDLDKATLDVLHAFELNKISDKEKLRLSNILINIRKDRRYYKDRLTILGVIADPLHAAEEKGVGVKKAFGILEAQLNYATKLFNQLDTRRYTPRVLKQLAFEPIEKKENN